MQTYEVGVLPQSKFFFFSPTKKKQGLFYHLTMCGHFFCTSEYYIKRDSFPPLLLVYTCSGSFHLELDGKSRMNEPGTLKQQNWRWRMLPGAADLQLAKTIAALTQEHGRAYHR